MLRGSLPSLSPESPTLSNPTIVKPQYATRTIDFGVQINPFEGLDEDTPSGQGTHIRQEDHNLEGSTLHRDTLLPPMHHYSTVP